MALFLRDVNGVLTCNGNPRKETRRQISATLSFASGIVRKETQKRIVAVLSFASGIVSKETRRQIAAVLSFASGAVSKETRRQITAVLSFAGALIDNSVVIAGRSLNSSGGTLAGAIVKLFRTLTDAKTTETTSDASANYSIRIASAATHYIVAYKAGAPDVAGTSVNTLTGV